MYQRYKADTPAFDIPVQQKNSQKNGFDIEKIMKHPKFELLSPMDIYRLIRAKADRIHTVILTNEEAEILNSNIKSNS